jgi:hypothetical protein
MAFFRKVAKNERRVSAAKHRHGMSSVTTLPAPIMARVPSSAPEE